MSNHLLHSWKASYEGHLELIDLQINVIMIAWKEVERPEILNFGRSSILNCFDVEKLYVEKVRQSSPKFYNGRMVWKVSPIKYK